MDATLLEHILKQAGQVGKIESGMDGLREQHKSHAEQMMRDNMTINLKIDSTVDKLDTVIEYINTQKGQKIAIVGFATVFTAAILKTWETISSKLSIGS